MLSEWSEPVHAEYAYFDWVFHMDALITIFDTFNALILSIALLFYVTHITLRYMYTQLTTVRQYSCFAMSCHETKVISTRVMLRSSLGSKAFK